MKISCRRKFPVYSSHTLVSTISAFSLLFLFVSQFYHLFTVFHSLLLNSKLSFYVHILRMSCFADISKICVKMDAVNS